MKVFKAGDKLRRIKDNSFASYGMIVGNVYTFKEYACAGKEVLLEEVKDSWIASNFELVEEPIPFGKSLFGYKIKVKDEEQSRLIQEAVFEAGGGWPTGGCPAGKSVDTHSKFLWVDYDGEITHLSDNDEDFFINDSTPELILETVKTLRIVDTIPVKTQAEIEKENLQKVVDKLQQDLDNAKQQLNNIGGK